MNFETKCHKTMLGDLKRVIFTHKEFFLFFKVVAKSAKISINWQNSQNSVLNLLPPGLATWHRCFTEVFVCLFGFCLFFL